MPPEKYMKTAVSIYINYMGILQMAITALSEFFPGNGGICVVGAVPSFIAMVRDRKVFGR